MSKRSKKKSKKKIFIVFILLILIIGGYYMYDRYQKELIEKNRVKISYSDNLKVEINDEVVIKTFVKEIVNGELINGEDMIDTSKLGRKELELTVKNKDNENEKYLFEIDVIDTTKPIIEAKNEISSYIGNNVDLLKDVKVTDNSKEELKAKVVGDYDINKAGKYNLKYEVEDSSGNKSEYDFILNIVSDPNNKTFTTSKGFTGKVVNGVTYIDGILIVNKTYSLPSSYGNGLTSETRNAFNKMQADAKALGLNLVLSSGWRSYWDQQIIYNNYVKLMKFVIK